MLSRLLLLTALSSLTAFAQTRRQPGPRDVDEDEGSATPAALAAEAPVKAPERQSERPIIRERLIYSSPSGLFSMPLPVLEELGGRVMDDRLFVHFMDAYTTHISVGAVELDAMSRFERSVKSEKDFLISLFNKIILPQFKEACPATRMDNAVLLHKLKPGAALYAGTLHPGSTHFASRCIRFGPSIPVPVARRGTIVFTEGNYAFVVSQELGERATENTVFKMTPEQENSLLKTRLTALVRSMTITVPALAPAGAGTSAAPAAATTPAPAPEGK